MKPKVRDTGERKSTSIYDGGNDDLDIYYDELDKNNDNIVPKVIIKAKRPNSQYNFDDTTSELGTVAHNSEKYKSGAKSAREKFYEYDDSFLYSSGMEDFYEKQEKLKSTYNPSLDLMSTLKGQGQGQGQSIFDDENFNFDDIHETEKYDNINNPTKIRKSSQFRQSVDYGENFNFDDLHETEKYPHYYNNFNMRNSKHSIQAEYHDMNFNFDDIHEKEKYENYYNDMRNENKESNVFDDNFLFSDIHDMEKYETHYNNFNIKNQQISDTQLKLNMQNINNSNNNNNDGISELGSETEREQNIDSLRCLTRKPVMIYLDESDTNDADKESNNLIRNKKQIPSIRKIKSKSLRINNISKKENKFSLTDYLSNNMNNVEDMKDEYRERFTPRDLSVRRSPDDDEFSSYFPDDSSVMINDADNLAENTEIDEDMKRLTINLTDKLDFLIKNKRQSGDNDESTLGFDNSSLYDGDIEDITGAEILKNDMNQLNKLNSSQYIENPNDLSSFFEREQINFLLAQTKKNKMKSALGEIQESETAEDQENLDYDALKVSYLFSVLSFTLSLFNYSFLSFFLCFIHLFFFSFLLFFFLSFIHLFISFFHSFFLCLFRDFFQYLLPLPLQLMDPTARTVKKTGMYKAMSAKYSKVRENSLQLRNNNLKAQTGTFGMNMIMNNEYGGGSMTARSEGGMMIPLNLEKISPQSVNAGVSRGNLFHPKDSTELNTSVSDANLPIREEEAENKK